MSYRNQFKKVFPRWESIQEHLHRYYGLKTMVLAMLTLFFTTLIVTGTLLHVVPDFGFLFSEMWWHFVYLYWTSHLPLLLVFVTLFGTVLWFNAFQNAINRVFPMPPLFSEEEDRVKRLFRRLSRALSMIFGLEFIIAIPLLHLWALTLGAVITIGATGISLLAPMLASYLAKKQYLKSLAGYTFTNTASFNTAAKGTQAEQVLRELQHFAALRESNPISPSVAAFLERGDGFALWKGYQRLYEELAKFISVPSGWITAHHSATDAFAWALKIAIKTDYHIVFSDLEFHSMRSRLTSLISEVERSQRVHEIKLHDEHLEGRLDAKAIEDRLIDEVHKIAQSIQAERIIVLISHVVYLTGIVLDIPRIRDEILLNNSNLAPDRFVFMIDGAQAVGNIVVERRVIDAADFYISSGHKWLLTSGTLGLLIHDFNGKRLKFNHNLDSIHESLRPFSYAHFRVDDHTLAETVDLDPLISLNAMMAEFNRIKQEQIAEHNRALATLFNELTFNIPGISVVSTPVQSGIVSIRLLNARLDTYALARILETEFGMVGQPFEGNIMRFSFHYYMGQREVYDLGDALYKAMRLLESGTWQG